MGIVDIFRVRTTSLLHLAPATRHCILKKETANFTCVEISRNEVMINIMSQMHKRRKPLVDIKLFISGKTIHTQTLIGVPTKCQCITKSNLKSS